MSAQAFESPITSQPARGALVDFFDPIGVRMHFAAGEEIFAQEDAAEFVYRVIDGSIRTARLLRDGRRQIGDFYYPGDFFGLEVGAEHRFSAEALGDCEVLVIKRTAVNQYAKDSGRLERMIWAATAKELERTQEHLLLLGRKTACEKVVSFLMDIAGRFPGETTTLPMGRQDMADYLALTIETVSRMLTQLQAQGLIEFAGCRRFRINNGAAMTRLMAA